MVVRQFLWQIQPQLQQSPAAVRKHRTFRIHVKDLIELRVKKVWKGDEEKDRPNEVVFQITRSYEADGQVTTDHTFNEQVI